MTRVGVDVAIVGAGISGLTAAFRLQQAGHSTKVLEARRRVGGRVERLVGNDGKAYDGGGQFLSSEQAAVSVLLQELGLSRSRLSACGEAVTIRNGDRVVAPALAGGVELQELSRTWEMLDSLCMQIPHEAPWSGEHAREWDRQTFRSWTSSAIRNSAARQTVETMLMPAGPAEDVSLLHVLAFLQATGGTHGFLAARDLVVSGGTFRLPETLSVFLGDDVVLESPVTRIVTRRDGVVVESAKVVVEAAAAIVALAPPLIERIDFIPALSSKRRLMQQHWLQMPAIKSVGIYETPWWRTRGLSGNVMSDDDFAPVMLDASPSDGSAGVILGLTNYARRLPPWIVDDSIRRQTEFFAAIDRALGPGAPAPIEYLEGNWVGRRWSHGCAQMLPCGFLTTLGMAVREPVDRIAWAGTEVATNWAGYIEGAVIAAEHAVEAVSHFVTDQR